MEFLCYNYLIMRNVALLKKEIIDNWKFQLHVCVYVFKGPVMWKNSYSIKQKSISEGK